MRMGITTRLHTALRTNTYQIAVATSVEYQSFQQQARISMYEIWMDLCRCMLKTHIHTNNQSSHTATRRIVSSQWSQTMWKSSGTKNNTRYSRPKFSTLFSFWRWHQRWNEKRRQQQQQQQQNVRNQFEYAYSKRNGSVGHLLVCATAWTELSNECINCRQWKERENWKKKER